MTSTEALSSEIRQDLAWELYCEETSGGMDVRDFWFELSLSTQRLYLGKVNSLLNDPVSAFQLGVKFERAQSLAKRRLVELQRREDIAEVESDRRSLLRRLDVALNGDGAAQSPSLCDIVGQIEDQRYKLVRVKEMSLDKMYIEEDPFEGRIG